MTRSLWIERAVPHIRARIAEGVDHSARYTLTELLEIAGGDEEPDGYRTRSYWMAEQRGDEYHRGFRQAGLVLGFHPDERSQAVETVIFRLDRLHGVL
jgi:hypothetical protein